MNDSCQRNQTSDFILLGLSDNPEMKKILFVLFLIIYTVTLVGDLYIIALVILDSKLHNPMYFFLANFSFIDITLTSVVVPLSLHNMQFSRPKISFNGCFTQLYFFTLVANLEYFLLAVMGFDRYVAICNPFHYNEVMRWNVCGLLVVTCYVISTFHSLLYTLMISQLSFCASSLIHHFFCDLPPLLKLSCTDTFNYQLVEYTEGFTVFLSPFLCIVASYAQLISAILKMRSLEGRRKAFSTCSSHLTLVVLFYSTIFFMYFRPPSSYSLHYDKVVSVVYTVIIPMLNPFIYSLRNKDMTQAFRKVLGWRKGPA